MRMRTLVLICLLMALFIGFSERTAMADERPMILIGRGDVREKIAQAAWARAVYDEITQSVQPYVDRHKTDPEWIASRLQMHWQTQYARTFVNGAVWSHGEGRAPAPTVRFAGGRDWAVPYASPRLEDVRPFDEDARGLWLQNREKPGHPWEWAPVAQTGQIIERINERIVDLAARAAFLYWHTGDEAYAAFASDIFWTYVQGMYHRANPETVDDHRNARILGLATFEVIHEDIARSLAIAYDFLRDYLVGAGRDVAMVERLFKRWADRIIEGGNAHGNWNINQARFVVYLGLALQPNGAYADGRGREYYLTQFTTESSANQTALKDVIPAEYDAETGIWPEAPGYAFSVTNNILHLAQVMYNATGEDVIDAYPVLERAALVVFQYLFPNGRTVGFGDTYHQAPDAVALELMIARARRKGDAELERRLTSALRRQMALTGYRREGARSLFALTSFVGDLLDADPDSGKLATRTFYGPPVSLVIQRNGEDPVFGLMASLAGTAGGHAHANGMALELYGRGMALGPDAGRGSSYWQREHGEYYSRFAAHNTVVVDGVSDTGRGDYPFELLHLDPPSGAEEAVSKWVSFADAAFYEPKTGSDQRRQVSVVRTSREGGYYVDIFRSRRRDGQDVKHEYLYRNLGQGVGLRDAEGRGLALEATDELGSARGDMVGYDYFSDKRMVVHGGDFWAVFSASLESGPGAGMQMWMAGEAGRAIFAAMSPQARSIAHGSAPRELQGLTVPVVIVRQPGQAWTRPFAAVFEPFGQAEGPTISRIRRLDSSGDFVALAIASDRLNRRVDTVLSDAADGVMREVAGVRFQGAYGVVSADADGLLYLYLGQGTHLSAMGFEISAVEGPVAASLYRDGDAYRVLSTGRVRVKGALER